MYAKSTRPSAKREVQKDRSAKREVQKDRSAKRDVQKFNMLTFDVGYLFEKSVNPPQILRICLVVFELQIK